MRNFLLLVLGSTAWISVMFIESPVSAADKSQPIYRVIRTPKVKVPMRDGVNLGADIYRPDAPGKFPVLMLLRYFREGADHGKFFARRGYVVALVDSRWRGDSEGKCLSRQHV